MRHDLSYCVVDGHAVFLDIAADRYFRLPERLEQAFVAYVTAPGSSATAAAMLAQHDILVAGDDSGASPAPVPAPSRSAHEMPGDDAGSVISAIPEVMATTWKCHRRLRTRRLKEVIGDTVRYREERCQPPSAAPDPVHEQRVLQAASIFQSARIFAPITTRCLLDSISLVRFLARRRLHSSIVFGVTYDPFSAHCWVQTGDIALNENVGNAMAYTIIKVV